MLLLAYHFRIVFTWENNAALVEFWLLIHIAYTVLANATGHTLRHPTRLSDAFVAAWTMWRVRTPTRSDGIAVGRELPHVPRKSAHEVLVKPTNTSSRSKQLYSNSSTIN